jgi:microcystin-dependent protein
MKYIIVTAFIVLFPSLASADCSNPTGVEGKLIYNADYKVAQFCNGTNWIGMAGGATTTPTEIPTGAVMAFNLSACPSGWTAMTNMLGRFPVGAGGGYSLGDQGGADTVALSVAQMPSHNHSANPPNTSSTTTGNHSHSITSTQYSAADGVSGSDNPRAGATSSSRYTAAIAGSVTNTTGNHNHSVNIPSFNTSSVGSGTAHENRPPYMALLYCQKD